MLGNMGYYSYDHLPGWNGPFGMGIGAGLFLAPVMFLVVAWTLYWKYKALWHAAKHDHKWWFIALLVLNTVGILEILYLYVFAPKMDMAGHDEKKVPMKSEESNQ